MNDIETIKNPDFLKKLNNDELTNLAQDIRDFIIENVSKTGGHLSSNLGVVDLTIALLKVFDAEKDVILFDVGHQAYTYKILTGRAKEFSKLRQKDGLCGFESLKESKYDHYETGHSGTSISAGIGYAIAGQMDGKKRCVISIIGDGSFSNGLAYEALNHLGDLNVKQIIILNDNQMSISPNVGALHNLLDNIRSAKGYNNVKKDAKMTLKKTKLGKVIYKRLDSIKNTLKRIHVKQGAMFEDLGIKYYGPINGHEYKDLLKYLNIAKNSDGPVILHVITKKGYGYEYAEKDTTGKYHGISSFDIETGEVKNKTNLPSYSEIVSSYVYNYARKDKDIICITPGMCYGSKLEVIKDKLPKQYIDVGICEEHALVMANTLAIAGKKPFVFIYSTFMQRGIDAVIHDIARCQSNVTILIDRAGFVPADGSSHQGLFDIPLLYCIPNVVISQPKDAKEANDLIKTSLESGGPFVIRFPKENIKYDYNSPKTLEIGSWEEVKDGKDVVIISYGSFLNKALNVAEKLAKDNVDAKVINARFIKPYDQKMFNSLMKLNIPIIVYEESLKLGSLGSVLAMAAQEHGFNKLSIMAADDTFYETASREELMKKSHLTEEDLYAYIKRRLR